MTEEKDFSLITVSTDEEDDIVIQAGAVGAASEAAGEQGLAADASAEVEAPGAAAVPEGSAVETLDGAEVEDAAGGTVAGVATARAAAKREARAAQNAMLTTEEDLKAPMPFAGMQRAIVIVFLLLIVAFVAYWFLVRPSAG